MKFLFQQSFLVAAVTFLFACSDPPPPPNPNIEVLEKKIEALKKDIQKIESAIQNADSDPALKAKLQEDHKLTQSRSERLGFELNKIKPVVEAPAGGHGESKPAEGGHH